MTRRLLALNLTAILLAPWIAAVSGAVVPIVPCPMHRAGGVTSHDHTGSVVAQHDKSVEHHSPSKHRTSAQGCNCVGECGRSGAAFSVPENVALRESASAVAEATPIGLRSDFGSVARMLPDATGPPQCLLI